MSSTGCVLDLRMRDKQGTTVTDYSRYRNDGALTGCKWVEHGLEFNGSSDYVRIPDSESLSPTSAITAMVWVKGGSQSEKGVLNHYDSTINQRGFYLNSNLTGNKTQVILSDDGTYGGHVKNYLSSIVVFDNTWHLAGFSFDAGTLKLFVDGVEDTNPTKNVDAAITTLHNSTADVTVGCSLDSDTPINFFNGSIDQARIYNRALPLREIKAMYNATRHNYD